LARPVREPRRLELHDYRRFYHAPHCNGHRIVTPWIADAIDREREAQRAKWSGDHGWGAGDCSSPAVPTIVKVAVLSEECGEVARAVLDRTDPRNELIQVAAVCVAWLESLR